MIVIYHPASGARAELTKVSTTGATRTSWTWTVSHKGKQVSTGASDSQTGLSGALTDAVARAAQAAGSAIAQDAIRALIHEL